LLDGEKATDGPLQLRDDLSPERYSKFVGQWINQGATLVGGCCGTLPSHIAAIAASLRLRWHYCWLNQRRQRIQNSIWLLGQHGMAASIELNDSCITDCGGHGSPGAGFSHSIFKPKNNKRF